MRNRNVNLPNAGFKTGHQNDVWWIGANGKSAKGSEYNMLLKSRGLMKLQGTVYDPGAPTVIEHDGYNALNEWYMPHWAIKTKDRSRPHWETFVEFIKYLILDPTDAEWFLDHLAAKAQDPKYRGPCVNLTTPVQGSGRGTLEKILSDLWGNNNLSVIGLSELIDGLSGDGFNDWLLSMWVIVPEARDAKLTKAQESKSYEALKTGIDPQVTSQVIRKKYGGQGNYDLYGSFIICSNHEDILNIPPTDRRFLNIKCTRDVGTPEYFEKLNEWKLTNWCPMVWDGLLKRDVSHHSGFRPKSLQCSEERAHDQLLSSLHGQSPIDRIATAAMLFIDAQCSGIIHVPTVCQWVVDWCVQLQLPTHENAEAILKRILHTNSTEVLVDGKRKAYKVSSRLCYPRTSLSAVGRSSAKLLANEYDTKFLKANIQDTESNVFRDYVLEVFNEADL